jgi:hypothetical protein
MKLKVKKEIEETTPILLELTTEQASEFGEVLCKGFNGGIFRSKDSLDVEFRDIFGKVKHRIIINFK